MLKETWKRPKTIKSYTKKIPTECGSLFLTIAHDDKYLVEVRATIGKNGTCGNSLLDFACRALSMYLQSPEERKEIARKIDKNFKGLLCSNPFILDNGEKCGGCADVIARQILVELEKEV